MYPYDIFGFPRPQPPGRPPFGPPVGGPPFGPPPSFTPQQQPGIFAVDPGGIRLCRNKFTFIWPIRGRGFWTYLVFIGPRSVAGYRWTGRRWVVFGTDLANISSFVCY